MSGDIEYDLPGLRVALTAEHAAEQPVLHEHRCGRPIPTTWTTPTPTIQREDSNEPPF